MADCPSHIHIHEEGPREGFQIEPGPISTDDKIRFIEALAQGRGVSASEVRSGMGEGRVLGADAALAAGMVDGIATFDDVLAKMQASVRSTKPRSQSRLKQARDALALI